MKNIFNQLKDEETLQGYATESHKKEKNQRRLIGKSKATVPLWLCAFVKAHEEQRDEVDDSSKLRQVLSEVLLPYPKV